MNLSQSAPRLPPHLIAGGLALSLALYVSTTPLVTTAVQFVSPLLVILAVHLVWLAAIGGLGTGFAMVALTRTLWTTICIAGLTIFVAIVAPEPASADVDIGLIIGPVFQYLGCLGIVVIVMLIPIAIIFGITKLILKLFRRRDDNRKLDFGIVIFAFLAIGLASQEGVSDTLTIAPATRVASSITTSASPDRLWQAVGIATSPAFPLPAMLRIIPRPVAIVLDEGSALGARRVVHFVGREGAGDLALRVSQRTAEEAVYRVESDQSPIAGWITEKSLTFRVEPSGEGTRLTVVLDYDRRLSPAWFFGPYIRVAAFLAADVLARDTAERAAPASTPPAR